MIIYIMVNNNNMSNKKRALNAYNLYCQDEKVRGLIKEEHPDWSSGEVMRELGIRWKGLSDEEKKPFNEEAQKGKELFLESQQNEDDMIKVLKRPKSSYMHFSNDKQVRDKIKQENPDWKVTEIASHLGTLWNKMPPEEKKVWEDKASKEKQDLLENPQYIWKKKKVAKESSSLEGRIEALEKIVMELQHSLQQLTNNQEE